MERGRGTSKLDTARYYQAIHDPTSFHIHPLNFVLALAADIERLGSRLHEGTEATSLERKGDRWVLRSAHGSVTARHVVLAGNADLGRVQPRIARAVLPVATYVAVTRRSGRSWARRSAGQAPSPTRAAPATITGSSTATGCCGVAASPPIRASRRGCAR